MMRYTKIKLGLLGWLLLASATYSLAQSAESAPNELHALEADEMTTTNRLAYQQLALDKWKETVEYLQLAMDANKPTSWRMRAAAIARQSLDSSQKYKLDYWLPAVKKSKKNYTSAALLEELVQQQISYTINPEWDKMTLTEPLTRQTPKRYEGKLDYSHVIRTTNQSAQKIVQLRISFVLIKAPKQFGSETLDIWQIQFTSIETRP